MRSAASEFDRNTVQVDFTSTTSLHIVRGGSLIAATARDRNKRGPAVAWMMRPRAPGEGPASRPGRVPPDLCASTTFALGAPTIVRSRAYRSAASEKGAPAMNRRIFPAIVFAMLGALLWPPQAQAQLVHYVDNVETCAGLLPCYTAIMDAVNAAMPSDSIEVFPGVYHEAAVFDRTKNNIILRARIAAL